MGIRVCAVFLLATLLDVAPVGCEQIIIEIGDDPTPPCTFQDGGEACVSISVGNRDLQPA